MNILKFWAVFTVGVASGAIVALICAPQSGEKTRRQLKRKLEDAGETLGDHAEKVVKRGKDALEGVADSATRVAGKAVKTVSDLV